ncbi:MAG: phosphotransacetylase family protein [Chloroflexi bacterium]|nr:phosphotransacetylase family protein [Chloroflexota bacterium]
MVALYITSMAAAGKTALCAGIGKKLLDRGVKVGFLTPVQIFETSGTDGCEDAIFIKEIFELTESSELLCPIRSSQRELLRSLTDEVADFTQRLKQAYRKISRDKNIVIMEGVGNLGIDKVSTLACYTIAETLEARVIIVLRYSSTLDVSKIAQIGKRLGQRLLGIIINFVPKSKMETARQNLTASFQKAGIKVLGILPEVRSLLGVSIGELVKILEGELLTFPENNDEIVENILVGAMTLDSGIDYFNRKQNKAAVIRGERSDMQLAALETSTKCLILTNNLKPSRPVISQAEEKHVPIIVVKQDTPAAIACIEEALTKASFRSPRKLDTFGNVLDCYFDFKALYSELGLEA